MTDSRVLLEKNPATHIARLTLNNAERKNSYWHLQVERAGTYRFELRRWPRESGLSLTEACPAVNLTDGEAPEGLALPIASARLLVGRQRHIQPVAPADESAVFTVQLEAGPTLLHTWFYDGRDQPLCGAYYVYVSRADGERECE